MIPPIHVPAYAVFYLPTILGISYYKKVPLAALQRILRILSHIVTEFPIS
jgi:hypothetical protein